MDLAVILISIFIAVLGMIAGGVYWSKLKAVVKQVGVLFDMIIAAIEDDQVTREELDMIVKEAKELFNLFKGNASKDLKSELFRRRAKNK